MKPTLALGISFRISCKETSTDRIEQQFATPRWVMEAGAQGGHYRMGKATGPEGPWEPALDDPVFELEHYGSVRKPGNWDGRPESAVAKFGKGKKGGPLTSTSNGRSIGPELGFGFVMGQLLDEPVLVLKSCIGNRSLGWDLLPPGSERYEAEVTERGGQKVRKVFAGYKDKPDSWPMDMAKGLATEPPPWLDKKPASPSSGMPVSNTTTTWPTPRPRSPTWRRFIPTTKDRAMKSPALFGGRATRTLATPSTLPITSRTSRPTPR